MPTIEIHLKIIKITIVRKYNLIFCRFDLSSLVVTISSPFRHTIAVFRRLLPALRFIPAHFDVPYPPHFATPHPHILTHETRTFRRTVPGDTVAKRGSVMKRSLDEKRDTVCKTRSSVAKRVQLKMQG